MDSNVYYLLMFYLLIGQVSILGKENWNKYLVQLKGTKEIIHSMEVRLIILEEKEA